MTDQEHPISLDLVISESNSPLAIDPQKQQLVDTLNPLVPRIGEYQAKAEMVVTNEAEAMQAACYLQAIAADIKSVEAVIQQFKAEAKRRHSLWCDLEGVFTESFKASYKKLKQSVINWQAEQERKAEAERRRLQAEADEKARREREAMLKKAAAVKTEEKKEQYKEAAAQVIAPVIAVNAPKSGVKMQTRWAVKSFNMDAMGIPRDVQGYIEVKTANLARAKAANPMLEVNGVEFHQVRV